MIVVAVFALWFLSVLAAVIWSDERKRRPLPVPEAEHTPVEWYLLDIEETP